MIEPPMTVPPTFGPRGHSRRVRLVGLLAVLLVLLAIPAPEPDIAPPPAAGQAFVWNRDSLWRELEAAFVAARAAGCSDSVRMQSQVAALRGSLDTLDRGQVEPTDPILDTVEAQLFTLAPEVAACPAQLEAYLTSATRMRDVVKQQSRAWDVTSRTTRDRLYRALYGSRAALEEVMLQQPTVTAGLIGGVDEPSATPSALVHGVRLHSGDILVSRGGYPTSALIARGNDYPGNFSHVGLVHVDSVTRAVSVIEAHIELGVAIATAEGYLADKKLRLMVLRPRASLPQLVRDPGLPHRAATAIRDRALAGHIPYDFAMDYRDPSRLFCSEVASSAYRDQGVELWMGISTISGAGLRRWLGAFGVKHFETQEPSDLEYDPQLVVVAEWRDLALLFRDHVDNAVTDVMLEGAERGDPLDHPWYQLPAGRLAKGYSMALARFGRTGPIPEGMSAAAALRNRAYGARHAALAAAVHDAASAWQQERGYPPPYWTLVELARNAAGSPPPSPTRP